EIKDWCARRGARASDADDGDLDRASRWACSVLRNGDPRRVGSHRVAGRGGKEKWFPVHRRRGMSAHEREGRQEKRRAKGGKYGHGRKVLEIRNGEVGEEHSRELALESVSAERGR